MKKVSLSYLLNNRKRIKIRTVISCVLAGLLIFQLLTSGGLRKSEAAIGELESTPYVINDDGFIWYDSSTSPSQSYYVRGNVGPSCQVEFNDSNDYGDNTTEFATNKCFKVFDHGRNDDAGGYHNISNNLTGKYVVINPNKVVVMWGGPHHFAGLTVLKNAIVTHAPLVTFGYRKAIDYGSSSYKPPAPTSDYFDGAASLNNDFRQSAVFSPGYNITDPSIADPSSTAVPESDFSLDTGVLMDLGLIKKVDINASQFIRVLGGKIDVTGRGYPGGEGRNSGDLLSGKIVSHQRYDGTNSNNGDYADNISNTPIGFPTKYGGYGGQVYVVVSANEAPNCPSSRYPKALGGGGNGYENIGGGFTSTDARTTGSCTYNSDYSLEPDASENYKTPHLTYGTTLLYGPGGGGSGRYGYDSKMYRGGSGGGYINLNSANIELSADAIIRANGQRGINQLFYSSNNRRGGGGGAGGVIKINNTTANGIIKVAGNTDIDLGYTAPNDGEFYNTMVKGGYNDGTGRNNGVGAVIFNGASHGILSIEGFLSPTIHRSNFSSAGGWGEAQALAADSTSNSEFNPEYHGSGGAGGLIQINGTFQTLCTLNSPGDVSLHTGDTFIPAYCEGADVVIDGASAYLLDPDKPLEVDAGYITVWQDDINGAALPNLNGAIAGEACNDPNNQLCDSKRHFNSLTIKNNANLTHEAILRTETDSIGSDRSIVDDVTGTLRWKKVDITLVDDLTLDSGGKIDVIGKGYPGAYNDGCSMGSTGTFHTFNRNGNYGYGWGPGGGRAFIGIDYARGGGGGFGGEGQEGKPTNNSAKGSGSYDYKEGLFELGSGGGSVSLYSGGDHSCYSGGNGGGRIILEVANIHFKDIDSKIVANGENGKDTQNGGITISAGGGSGGLIYVKMSGGLVYEQNLVYSAPDVSGGYFYDLFNQGSNLTSKTGKCEYLCTDPETKNFSAKGGSNWGNLGEGHSGPTSDYGGGGGGWIVINMLIKGETIKKTLTAVSRGGSASFNPYALEKGDKIKVTLEVSHLTPENLYLKDEMLKVPFSNNPIVYCAYQDNTLNGWYGADGGSINPTEYTNQTLKWSHVIKSGEKEHYFSYDCEVQ